MRTTDIQDSATDLPLCCLKRHLAVKIPSLLHIIKLSTSQAIHAYIRCYLRVMEFKFVCCAMSPEDTKSLLCKYQLSKIIQVKQTDGQKFYFIYLLVYLEVRHQENAVFKIVISSWGGCG